MLFCKPWSHVHGWRHCVVLVGVLYRSSAVHPSVMWLWGHTGYSHVNCLELFEFWWYRAHLVAHFISFPRHKIAVNIRYVDENLFWLTCLVVVVLRSFARARTLWVVWSDESMSAWPTEVNNVTSSVLVLNLLTDGGCAKVPCAEVQCSRAVVEAACDSVRRVRAWDAARSSTSTSAGNLQCSCGYSVIVVRWRHTVFCLLLKARSGQLCINIIHVQSALSTLR